VFGLIPSHKSITYASESLIFVTAAGALLSIFRHRSELSEKRAR
jgi:hypothetical protein